MITGIQSLGKLRRVVEKRLERISTDRIVERFWSKDATLWPGKEHFLGWQTIVPEMRKNIDELQSFAAELRKHGFHRMLLMGMGGSSLAPEVLARTFGAAEGHLELRVLDSTDPAEVRAAEAWADKSTLFLVSSKSGTTSEVRAFLDYFWKNDGRRFAAITDPGSPLDELATERLFRRVFRNPKDIGGRYSALSYFGLVPAALLGVDLVRLLDNAEKMRKLCDAGVPADQNPGARLGVILAECAMAGRDKLTLLLSPEISSLGGWIEQLVAESTGKEGGGILPVDGEPISQEKVYGDDRLFLYSRCGEALDPNVVPLKRSASPFLQIDLTNPYEIGAEFVRWCVGTAVAGAILQVNPFDQPNVQESKTKTKELLGKATLEDDDRLEADASAAALLRHLDEAADGDYFALLAYVSGHRDALQKLRRLIRNRFRIATSLGIGPRFLHSTGQYFKGGPNKGIFLHITCGDRKDAPIPGREYGFSHLKQAQAVGDYLALKDRGRRVVRCHLDDVNSGIERIVELVTRS